MAKELTQKQELFVAAYLVDLNAKRAAIAAGYSEKSAESQGVQLLQNPKVSQRLQKKLGLKLEKLDISSDRILQELAKLAFFDPVDLFETDGSVKRIADIPEDVRKVLAGFEVTEIFDGASGEQRHAIGLLKKIKVCDRLRALELLGKYQKLLTDKVVHEHKLTLEMLVCGESDAS